MNKSLEQIVEAQEKEIERLKLAINQLSKKLAIMERMARRAEDGNRRLTENVRVINKKLGG